MLLFLSPYIPCNFVPLELQEMYMAETLFNKIISTIAILSKFILPHL